MQSKSFSIAIVSLFVLGVAAWYGARYWAFDRLGIFSIIPVALSIGLAINFLRGEVFSRWLIFAFSTIGAYSSLNLFGYIRSREILVDSREIAGDAFLLPGILFSICVVLLVVSFLTGRLRKQQPTD